VQIVRKVHNEKYGNKKLFRVKCPFKAPNLNQEATITMTMK